MGIFKNYFFSGAFWRNLIIASCIFLGILLFIFLSFRIYTHHNHSLAVPDFTDMSFDEAVKKIEEKNMRYEISDSQFVAGKAPKVILDQHPKPNFLVKKNRKIFLTVNASSPGKIEMPNLVGITLREARIKLGSYGLELGELFYKYDISENVVLGQQFQGKRIAAHDSIIKGSKIDLIIGKGLANVRRMVPNLVGLTLEEAQIVATNATFNIGAVIEDNTISGAADSLKPFIFRQKPESNPDILRPLGSTISLYVTVDSTKNPNYKPKQEDPDYVWEELNDGNEADSSYNNSNTN